jgi:hypothetical protein
MPYGDRKIWSNEIEAHLMFKNNNQLVHQLHVSFQFFLHYYIKNLERNKKIIKPQRHSCFSVYFYIT